MNVNSHFKNVISSKTNFSYTIIFMLPQKGETLTTF